MSCPIVHCRNGGIQGSVIKLKSKDAKPVFGFRNIPYGKPPLGKLRFLAPQPAESWDGIRDGTVTGKSPMQALEVSANIRKYTPTKETSGTQEDLDEDCLHLSVYTPQPHEKGKLPVMIWYHGGGFEVGTERMYEGSALAGLGNVVTVIPNYRLNVFGFLSLGPSSVCPGNAGLLDQRMAMQWIQDNIAAFGGDKNNVTVFGESAGGASANHHLNSTMSNNLFHKAISQSGQATLPNYFSYEPKKSVRALLKYFGIEETDDKKILKALQELPASDLIKAMEDDSMKNDRFQPCVDGEFLKKTPEQSLVDKDARKVPYIIGCNSTEWHGLMPTLFGLYGLVAAGMTEQKMKELLDDPPSEKAYSAWKEFYIKDEADIYRFSKMYCDFNADKYFVIPAVESAAAYADDGWTVYMYHGAFRFRFNHDPVYGPAVGKKVDWCVCDHGDEMFMIFGVPFTPGELPGEGKFSEAEKELSRKFITYITNFAKHGDPNKGEKVDVKWPLYGAGRQHILIKEPIEIGANLASGAHKLWSQEMK